MNNVKKVLTKLGTKTKDFFMSLKEKKEKLMAKLAVSFITALELAAPAFAEAGGGGGGDVDPDAAFNNIIGFMAKWIGRIGLVIAFVGAVMFGLAIKNDDADGKQRGLMTLGAGFVVFAVTKALDMFGLTAGTM